jgi:hypothetical protein
VDAVRAAFRKTRRRGYAVEIARERHEDLTMNPAPGYVDLLPHDLVHLLVELHWGLRDGIYGELATGGNAGTFRLADARPERGRSDPTKSGRNDRRERRSELARKTRCQPTRSRAALAEAESLSARWRQVQIGDAMTLEWT